MFAALLEGLTSAGVRFVVIGGVAAGLHGSVRATLDLDICTIRRRKTANGWRGS